MDLIDDPVCEVCGKRTRDKDSRGTLICTTCQEGGDVTVTSPCSEPEYRLVADESDPLTIDAVAGVTEPPVPHIMGDPLSDNYEAAKRVATLILRDVREDVVRDDSERILDVVSDMFHLCDLLGIDMDDVVNRAQRNYDAEIRGVL